MLPKCLLFAFTQDAMSSQSYKLLQRQLRRLPLPQGVICDGSKVLKQQYLQGKSKRFELLFHQILDQEQYKKLTEVLDAIYKVDKPAWYREFINIPYMKVKRHWPTIHLIDTLTDNSSAKKTYYCKLAKPFSVTQSLNLKPDEAQYHLPLLKKFGDQVNPVVNLIKEVHKTYQFVVSQKVFEVTKHPFEVFYYPSKLGIPEHPVGIDCLLRKKVSSVKHVLETFQPISKEQLTKLMNANGVVNPRFYHHLQRKRSKVDTSFQVKKLIIKEKILGEEQLQDVIRKYLQQQYYLENANYKLNKL
ncbi:hypothetical protein CANMA_001214 [Candida margitis]|uniref:uncharacterized protein n=1 Tax=Candida margitis TaxID=1775924 RepID=UPI0022272414|nr:uncharacterized protein CANMA_001214 [Candida margitis]KAI5969752.1 hypothetical protein CANMA_001214 [Candida margitis]